MDSKNILKLRIDKIQEENKLAEKFDISLLNNDLNEAKLKAEKLIMNFIKDWKKLDVFLELLTLYILVI